MTMGSHGFGAASSKVASTVVAQAAPGGFTAAELQQHTSAMQMQACASEGVHNHGSANGARHERMARFLADQPLMPMDGDRLSLAEPEPEPRD